MKRISIISLFPQALEAYLSVGMLAKATALKIVRFELIDLRQFGLGRRRQVDDTPYGGGSGMVLRIEPLVAALEDARAQSHDAEVVLLTPRGQLFKQATARSLAQSERDLILIGGRYEGYDERLVNWIDRQISIGHYVLTGSELPALVVADSVVRLLDGVLGGADSAEDESFNVSEARLEYPQYTKPEVFHDLIVPAVLLSGNHQEIAAWRRQQSQIAD